MEDMHVCIDHVVGRVAPWAGCCTAFDNIFTWRLSARSFEDFAAGGSQSPSTVHIHSCATHTCSTGRIRSSTVQSVYTRRVHTCIQVYSRYTYHRVHSYTWHTLHTYIHVHTYTTRHTYMNMTYIHEVLMYVLQVQVRVYIIYNYKHHDQTIQNTTKPFCTKI